MHQVSRSVRGKYYEWKRKRNIGKLMGKLDPDVVQKIRNYQKEFAAAKNSVELGQVLGKCKRELVESKVVPHDIWMFELYAHYLDAYEMLKKTEPGLK